MRSVESRSRPRRGYGVAWHFCKGQRFAAHLLALTDCKMAEETGDSSGQDPTHEAKNTPVVTCKVILNMIMASSAS